jgi:D-glycero-alpha-D-manno-heptose 1-phosphate guanylyltransferase
MPGETAAILVGGLGTRLRSAVPDVPKPLAPVQGRPFLDRLLDWAEREGVERAVLLCGFGAEALEEFARARRERGAGPELECSVEPERLGTGGAIRHGLERLPETFFLVNGDTLCPLSLAELAAGHDSGGNDATLAAVEQEDGASRGALEFGADGRVAGFMEKGRPGPGWINAGVYRLRRELFEGLAPGRPLSLETDLLPDWIAKGRRIGAFKTAAPFLDIGTPQDWERAQREGWLT